MTHMGRTSVRVALGLGLLALAGCNTAPFQAISVRPVYGYGDACTDVAIGGSGFADDVSVMVGDQPLMNATLPETDSLDYGYLVSGTIPPVDGAEGAFVDVVVTSDGESDTVLEQFYRVACPGAVNPEAVSPAEGVAAGDPIALVGCHMFDTYTVRIQGIDAPLTNASSCEGGTDTAVFDMVQVADPVDNPETDDLDESTLKGWYITIYDGDTEIYPLIDGCDPLVPVGASLVYDEEGKPVKDDNDEYLDACAGALSVTYADGAE